MDLENNDNTSEQSQNGTSKKVLWALLFTVGFAALYKMLEEASQNTISTTVDPYHINHLPQPIESYISFDETTQRRELGSKRKCRKERAAAGEKCGNSGKRHKKCCGEGTICQARICVEPIEVFMVGNSFSIRNSMSKSLQKLSRVKKGDPLIIGTVFRPATTLLQHATTGYTYDILASREDWDRVVMQPQSQEFERSLSKQKVTTYLGAEVFAEIAKNRDADAVLFMTWGYQYGNPGQYGFGDTYEDMQQRIANGNEALQTYLKEEKGYDNVVIAPVGLAWQDVKDKLGESEFKKLYNPDGRHPSKRGSLLSAYVLYCSIEDTDLSGPRFKTKGISKKVDTQLKNIAKQRCAQSR